MCTASDDGVCNGSSEPTIEQVDGDLVATEIPQTGFEPAQSGDYPWDFSRLAAGPTGFVCVDDDDVVWFGSPTA